MKRLPIYLQPLHESDYDSLLRLWSSAGGVQLRASDTPEALARFLRRNPQCSFGAYAGARFVGAILAGHDGWRGYLYHLAVKASYRERNIGTQLVNAAVAAIKQQGIPKIHCLVKCDNPTAQQFWEACGFTPRDDVLDYSL